MLIILTICSFNLSTRSFCGIYLFANNSN